MTNQISKMKLLAASREVSDENYLIFRSKLRGINPNRD